MTVSIKVGAELDAAQINQQLADLTRRINSVGQAIAQAGRVRFEPIPRASLEIAQRIEQSMRNMQRISPDLHKKLAATGQGGAAFDQIDWSRLYGDATQRHRAQRRMFEMATGLGFGALPPMSPGMPPGMPPPRGPGLPVPGGRPFLPNVLPELAPSFGMPGRIGLTAYNAGRASYNAAGGGMRGFGAGMAGGLGAGLGFAAIQGIGALISGVREHVGAAQQESIGYADLYRRMGGRGSGNHFGALRYQMRGVSDAIGVSYDEVLGLSNLAARRGNLNRAGDLAGMVEFGGGFGRSFGFDPGAGVAAFAGLRGVGATRSVDESRRLGLAIAEGIARAGVFAKAEEYLSEIASFGEQSARSGLVRPNMEGFNEALSALVGRNIPGLDVRGAANLLTSADAAIRRGGAAGEAGQAFLYQTVGRRLGLDPIQVGQMQEGGIFATGRGTFGSGLVADYYRRMGLAIPEGAANDDTTILEMVTDGLRSQYTGGNRRVAADAAANLLGVNQRQAMALLSLDRTQITGMRGLLSEEQLRGLSATGIQTMGRIATAGRDELGTIADGFKGRSGNDRLSGAERDRLERALRGGTDDELRKVLSDIAAGRQAEETEGDETRRTLQGIDKTLTNMATALVPAMNTARDALLRIAGRNGRSATARELAEDRRNAEVREADQIRNSALIALEPQIASAADEHARLLGLANNNPDDAGLARAAEAAGAEVERLAGQRRRIDAEHAAAVAAANSRRDAAAPRGTADVGPDQRRPGPGRNIVSGEQRARVETYLDETDRVLGLRPGTSRAQIAQESGWDANVVSSAGAQGLAQFMPATRRNIERRLGRALNPFDPDDAALLHRELMTELMGQFGNQDDALRAYNAGPNRARWNNSETQGYVPAIEARRLRAARGGAPATGGVSVGTLALPEAIAPELSIGGMRNAAMAAAEYDRMRGEAAAFGVPMPATPMPADAPAGAVQAAGGGAQALRVEGTAAVDVTVRNEAGVPSAPPARAPVVLRPARPYGATRQGLGAYR